MEFSVAEILAIGAILLNVIVYFSRIPSKNDIRDLRNDISRLDEKFTNHLMFMHNDKRPVIPND